jgi:hypothetical protein
MEHTMQLMALNVLFGDSTKCAKLLFGSANSSFLVALAASRFGSMMSHCFGLIAGNQWAGVAKCPSLIDQWHSQLEARWLTLCLSSGSYRLALHPPVQSPGGVGIVFLEDAARPHF